MTKNSVSRSKLIITTKNPPIDIVRIRNYTNRKIVISPMSKDQGRRKKIKIPQLASTIPASTIETLWCPIFQLTIFSLHVDTFVLIVSTIEAVRDSQIFTNAEIKGIIAQMSKVIMMAITGGKQLVLQWAALSLKIKYSIISITGKYKRKPIKNPGPATSNDLNII